MIFKNINLTKIISQYSQLNKAVERYNNIQSKSQSFQTAYNNTLQKSQSNMGMYLASLNGAKASITGYVKYLISAKASTVALQLATNAMNIALKAGVIMGVSLLVNQINKWIHAQEEARQKSIELTNAYKEQQSSLDEQIEKYKELKKELDSGNLSINESRSIKEQLLEIQKNLIESYGDEVSNIDLVNGKYKEQLGLLSALSKEKASTYVKENRSAYEDAKKELEKTRSYKIGSIFSYESREGMSDEQKQLYEYIKSYSDLFEIRSMYDTSTFSNSDYAPTLFVNANADEAKVIIDKFYDDIEKYIKDNNLQLDYDSLQIDLSKVSSDIETDDTLKEYRTIYDEFMKAEIVRNDTLRPLYQESIQAVEDYNKALSTGEGVEEAKANLESVQQSVQGATGELEGSQSVFDGIYEGINKDAEAAYNLGKAFENDKTVQSYAEQLRGLTDVDLKAINFDNTNTEKGEEAFKGLMETLGLTEEQVQSLIDKLVELGYVQGEVQGSTLDNEITDSFSYDKLSDIPQKLAEVENAYKTAQDALDSYNEKGYYSMDVIDSILSLEDEYINVLVDENGQLQINSDSMNQLAAIKIEAAKASIYQETCEELVRIKTLDTSLAAQELALVNGTLTESAYETAKALYEEVQAMGGANAVLANNVWDSATKKVKLLDNQLKSLNSGSYNVGKSAMADSAKKAAEDATQKAKSYIEAYMDFQQKSLESGKIDYNTYCNTVSNLLKSMFKDGKIAAKDYHDYTKEMLEVQKSIYDKVIKAVVRRIEKEIDSIQNIIDGLQKQNDVLEKQKDEYDSILSVVDSVYEKQIQALEDEKQLLQDKIDAINDANSALDLQYRKEQALYELECSQSQRTKKLLVNGEITYVTDQTAIRDAKKNLQDIETEEFISNLEKEQKAIDKSIEELEKYRDLWKEISDVYDKEVNQQLAIALWGKDYEKIILSNRLSDIENFKDKYISTQKQINDNQSLIDSYNEKIEYYENLKDQWNSLSDEYKNSVEEQYAAMLLGQNWEADVLSGRLDKLNDFRNQYISIQRAIADAAWESANEQIKAAQEAEKCANGTIHDNPQNVNYTDYGDTTDAVKAKEKDDLAKQIENAQIKLSEARTALSKAPDNTARASKQKLVNYYETLLKDLNIRYSKYATGTLHAQRGLHLVSEEEYGDEIILPNDGSAVLAKGEQLYPFKGGETVIKASETEKILANMGNLVPIETDEIWKKFADNMPDLSSMVKLDIPDYSKLSSVVMRNNNQQPNITIGDIHLHEVNNVDSLANAIIRELPSKISQKLGQ